MVTGDDSTSRIDEIRIGDTVKAYDNGSGEIVTRFVTSVNSGEADYYFLINGNLKVTPPHPFFVIGKGWVPVENLNPGDEIKSLIGNTLITSIELIYEKQDIYNIGVEGGNYFVSADGIEFYLVQQGD